MRAGRVLIMAAVVLAGVTGCGNRPNNLETYYDQPGSSPSTTAEPVQASPSEAAQPETGSTTSAAAEIAQQVSAAVLTAQDLVHQGAHAATTRPANGACFDAVPSGDPRSASWVYNSGSTLTQQVTGYLDKQATDVLAQVRCGGNQLNMGVALPAGAEMVRGWCEATTCTVLLARGHVLSGLQVTASTPARASDAVRSLVQIAAGRLPKD